MLSFFQSCAPLSPYDTAPLLINQIGDPSPSATTLVSPGPLLPSEPLSAVPEPPHSAAGHPSQHLGSAVPDHTAAALRSAKPGPAPTAKQSRIKIAAKVSVIWFYSIGTVTYVLAVSVQTVPTVRYLVLPTCPLVVVVQKSELISLGLWNHMLCTM